MEIEVALKIIEKLEKNALRSDLGDFRRLKYLKMIKVVENCFVYKVSHCSA